MTNATTGAALIGGYVLGRTKKARLAIAVATWLVRKRIDPKKVSSLIADSPALEGLTGQLRGQLGEAGKKAAISAVTARADRLADQLHTRTERLRRGEDEEPPEGDELEDDETDDEPESDASENDDLEGAGPGPDGPPDEEDQEDQEEDEDDEEEAPEEPPPPRKRAPAKKSTAKKAPAQKTAAKPAAKKAAAKKTAAPRAAAEKSASRTQAPRKRTGDQGTTRRRSGS
ncbi:histone protein [Streptomyces sp. ODS05-4]|uniref:histone protein n=1 Tax=Streptomyces sp. ODS05-4 TaxID=2944939 RepID=UPI00210D30FE|nr:histone protein [Streptomyces sp. ODS05-4]